VFSTAFDALFTHAGLAMGERVLISGAAGSKWGKVVLVS
jgi:NADPH:quinone reductase-like Zn-dependent oxidoreductase